LLCECMEGVCKVTMNLQGDHGETVDAFVREEFGVRTAQM